MRKRKILKFTMRNFKILQCYELIPKVLLFSIPHSGADESGIKIVFVDIWSEFAVCGTSIENLIG